MDFLKLLSETPGVPGREERVRQVIQNEITGLFHETRVDDLGNLICIRKADKVAKGKTAKRVLIAAHMDQIGFYVRYVDDRGFIRLHNVGGFDPRTLPAHRVLIQGKKDLYGMLMPGIKPIHIATDEERRKTLAMTDFYVDVGLPGKKVKELVRVGDPVTLVEPCMQIGDLVCGQAMDNRVSVWTVIRAMQRLRHSPCEIVVVFSVQEEVGVRGAGPATYGVQPDVAIAVDTTLACDIPGVPAEQSVSHLGKGAGIKIMDSSIISDRALVDSFVSVAVKHKITHQLELLPLGGNDASVMQRSRAGMRAITISIPTRYIHTVNECVNRNDLHATRDLLAAWLEQGI
jgi:putative aminopeptidase FrvX